MNGIRLQAEGFGGAALCGWRWGLLVAAWIGGLTVQGGEVNPETGALPEAVTAEDFAAVKAHSPFLRSIGLSDSIVLTGMARIEDDLFATVMNTATMESHLVSGTANAEGWQLVEVEGNESDLESLTAKIQVAGGEVVSIRYSEVEPGSLRGIPGGGSRGGGEGSLDASELQEARQAAFYYRKGFSSDGFRDEPPPEVVEKLSRMPFPQREAINRRMIELRNRGMGRDERRRVYLDLVDRGLQGTR